tara:strand:+ start:4190 stop:4903 length:714 start_codon:yes stop_codon:yes gene_type:complete
MKNKLLNEIKIDWDYRDLDPEGKGAVSKINLETHPNPFIFTEDKRIIQAFAHLHNGKHLIIPELNPTILYLSSSQEILNTTIQLKAQLLELAGVKNYIQTSELFIRFFPQLSLLITSLFTAIEAFNNGLIPDDFSYHQKGKYLNKVKIQRWIKFKEKTEQVIPEIFNRSFVVDFPKKYETICEIKNLRDDIIHTKNRYQGMASYRDIYKNSLLIDFENAYQITCDYINFYDPNLIEE